MEGLVAIHDTFKFLCDAALNKNEIATATRDNRDNIDRAV